MTQTQQQPVLRVIDLQVTYYTDSGRVRALDGASFTLNPIEKWDWSANPAPANRPWRWQ